MIWVPSIEMAPPMPISVTRLLAMLTSEIREIPAPGRRGKINEMKREEKMTSMETATDPSSAAECRVAEDDILCAEGSVENE